MLNAKAAAATAGSVCGTMMMKSSSSSSSGLSRQTALYLRRSWASLIHTQRSAASPPAVLSAVPRACISSVSARSAALAAAGSTPSVAYTAAAENATPTVHDPVKVKTRPEEALKGGSVNPDVPPLTVKPRLQIFYGSQTGTAMNFAMELGKQAKRKHGLEVEVIDLLEYQPEQFIKPNTLNVFALACFGHGEPTQNARPFYDWLQSPEREKEREFFSQMKVCVFGLGQSVHYPQRYQAVGKYVHKRLQELGAQVVFARGEGDSAGDIEQHFEDWATAVFTTLDALPAPAPAPGASATTTAAPAAASSSSGSAPAASSPESLFPGLAMPSSSSSSTTPAATGGEAAACAVPPAIQQVERVSSSLIDQILKIKGSVPNNKHPYPAKVTVRRELHSEKSKRSCQHLEYSLRDPQSNITYTAGDYLGVMPMNSPADVEAIADRLFIDKDAPVAMCNHPSLADTLHNASLSETAYVLPEADIRAGKFRLQNTVTFGQALQRFYDVSSPPRKTVLRALAAYAQDEEEKKKLLFLSSGTPLGNADYQSWVVDARVSLKEVLHCFPSINGVSSADLLDMLPLLQPRYYSICSSPRVFPDSIHTAVAVVHYTSAAGYEHWGVCSGYLSRRLKRSERVPVFVKESLFRLPADPATPILMIGAGTGIAPFRGFIQERLKDTNGGTNTLVFGVDSPYIDYLYEQELNAAVQRGRLELINAFAFVKPWRIFVQYRMVEPDISIKIWKLMKQGGHIYVCGDASRMAAGVHQALISIVQQHGNMNEEHARNFLRDMQANNVYQMDVF